MGKSKRAKDAYYKLAKEHGYRARSAFKLIQLNKKYNFLANSRVLIDLCAAPGGWLQVAAKYMPLSSLIIGVDLVPIKPIPGVITHAEDIRTQKCRQTLKQDLRGHQADVVLHDGAPNVGAAWIKDAYSQSELTLFSLKLAVEFLRPGGMFVTKVFRSADYHSLLWVFNQLFDKVEATKPHSSRNASAEIFVVCKGFKAPQTIDPRMLDSKFVFKEIAEDPKAASVLHKKTILDRKNRDGYIDALGPLQRRVVSILDFIMSNAPVNILSTATELSFSDSMNSSFAASLKRWEELQDGSEQKEEEEEEEGKERKQAPLTSSKRAMELLKKITNHPTTSDDVVHCCEDLKLLGRKDFVALLKWRMRIRNEIEKERKEANKVEVDTDSEGEEVVQESREAEDLRLLSELREEITSEEMDKKRKKKKEAKQKAKELQRRALRMNGQNVDLYGDDNLFSLDAVKQLKGASLDDVVDVDLENIDKEELGIESDEDEEEKKIQEKVLTRVERGKAVVVPRRGVGDFDLDDFDGEDTEEAYVKHLEEEMSRDYEEYLARKRRKIENPVEHKGRTMTRRQRMAIEAKVTEDAALKRLDSTHQKYLELLSSARKDEDDGEEDSDEYEVETMPEQDDGLDDLEGLPIGNGQADGEVDPRARAARWFSNPMFEDVEAEEQAIQLGKRKGKAQVNGDADMESSEDEEEVDEESEGEEEVEGEEVETSEDDEDYEPEDEDMEASASEAEEGDSEESEEEQDDSYGNIPLPLLTAEKKKALLERKSKQQAENLKRLAATGIVDFEQEDLPDPESFADLLKDISKSDRDRRKDKLRKAREKEARKKAKADAEMEIVAAEFDKEFTGGASNPGKYTEDGGSDSEGLTEEQLAAKRELIEAGMGRVIKGKKQQQQQRANGSGKFEVVKRGQELEEGDSDSSMDNEEDDAASLSEDPRNQEFDLETQAELLALGRQLKRHTTAKQLVDASYNRYSFNDEVLPSWFVEEEAQHFRPQLPITKDEVEKIKERFRDIAAAPIKKVAEARARKKMKAKRRMDKAKRKAEAIVSQEDRSEASKAREITRIMRKTEVKRPDKVYVVAKSRGTIAGVTNRKSGGQVKYVDKRLKADKRGLKAAEKRRTRKRKR